MNETNLNTELLSADARGRKHIPLAVFAVILVHIILFMVLLIAAGCRAKVRARRNLEENMARQNAAAPALAQAAAVPAASAQSAAVPNMVADVKRLPEQTLERASEAVRAEPIQSPEPGAKAQARGPEKARTKRGKSHSTASVSRAVKFYVVQAGDTMEKIARRHGTTIQALKTENKLKDSLLHPGQKLRVSSEKPKRSNEA
jgi:LysM repeat protein